MSQIADDIIQFYDDPLKFVLYAFPWGEKNTILEKYTGPDKWQCELLNNIRLEILKRESGDVNGAIRMAVTSGHGVGKSALVSWLVLWFISTRPHPQIIVTANTQNQLSSKTWREVAKWHKLAINKDWFDWTATTFYNKEHPETWKANAIPWSEHRPDAFAGTHEEHVLVILDEASGIPSVIWEVLEGALTTKGSMQFVFGNPNRNSGRFYECFNGKFKHRYIQYRVDSRHASMANNDQIQQWLEDYGEDSDFFKMRVRGEFPTSSTMQFIPTDAIENCRRYKAESYLHLPMLIGVDVARFGDDQSVIYVRQGRKTHAIRKFRGLNTIQLSHLVQETANGYTLPTIFIDGIGVGAGVVDYCRSLKMKVIEANSSNSPSDTTRYANKRAEMWDRVRQWLQSGAEIPNDDDLFQNLVSTEYSFTSKGQLLIESKMDLKSRGLASPDVADALCLTFYENVNPINMRAQGAIRTNTDWKPY